MLTDRQGTISKLTIAMMMKVFGTLDPGEGPSIWSEGTKAFDFVGARGLHADRCMCNPAASGRPVLRRRRWDTNFPAC
jgi:hypothetical protein